MTQIRSKSRNGNRWTINECLQLQREFELLNLPISEIACRHKRSPNAIMFKLDQEGLADFNVLYSNFHDLNDQMPTHFYTNNDDDEKECEIVKKEKNFILESESNNSEEQDDFEEDDSIKAHVMRLEKQVMNLTEMLMKTNKNKSLFSLCN
jgi:hypothetical protein